jgi:hypothetical protein
LISSTSSRRDVSLTRKCSKSSFKPNLRNKFALKFGKSSIRKAKKYFQSLCFWLPCTYFLKRKKTKRLYCLEASPLVWLSLLDSSHPVLSDLLLSTYLRLSNLPCSLPCNPYRSQSLRYNK